MGVLSGSRRLPFSSPERGPVLHRPFPSLGPEGRPFPPPERGSEPHRSFPVGRSGRLLLPPPERGPELHPLFPSNWGFSGSGRLLLTRRSEVQSRTVLSRRGPEGRSFPRRSEVQSRTVPFPSGSGRLPLTRRSEVQGRTVPFPSNGLSGRLPFSSPERGPGPHRPFPSGSRRPPFPPAGARFGAAPFPSRWGPEGCSLLAGARSRAAPSFPPNGVCRGPEGRPFPRRSEVQCRTVPFPSSGVSEVGKAALYLPEQGPVPHRSFPPPMGVVRVEKAALSPAGARSSAAPSFPFRRGARVTIHVRHEKVSSVGCGRAPVKPRLSSPFYRPRGRENVLMPDRPPVDWSLAFTLQGVYGPSPGHSGYHLG
jgi:hypothetical protein